MHFETPCAFCILLSFWSELAVLPPTQALKYSGRGRRGMDMEGREDTMR